MLKETVAEIEPKKALGGKIRAQRFSIQVPLRYRIGGENVWWRGTTQNISSSGLLFEGERHLGSNTAVEMNLILPAVDSEGSGEIICHGTIVRATLADGDGVPPALAAKILRYRLIRS